MIADTVMAELIEDSRRKFLKIYGSEPVWIASAPGRVNLIGDHTDYNNGFVFPMAIDRRTVVLARPNEQKALRVFSTALDRTATIDLTRPILPDPAVLWSNYIRGVAVGFLRLHDLSGMDICIHSNVPPGGGLSSSAALEVAVCTLFEAATGVALPLQQKALLCQQAERDFAGVPCGLMDQTASIRGESGQLMLMDCQSFTVDYVPFENEHTAVLVINSGVKHQLASGEYARRHAECQRAAKALGLVSLRDASMELLHRAQGQLDETLFRRARHVITENIRTQLAAVAMRESNWTELGRLMYESHASLRADYEVSCSELDSLVRIARTLGESNGMYGCRMPGGGFGGCAVALIRRDCATTVSAELARIYKAETGLVALQFLTQPSAGAAIHTMERTA